MALPKRGNEATVGRYGPVPVRSDRLADFRELALRIPLLQELFGVLPKVRVVVDANIALSEVLFLGTARRDLTARTALQELVASGTVVVYAPRAIQTEVCRHLPLIAAERQVSVDTLEAIWVAYRSLIHFYDPERSSAADSATALDPEDLPYRNTWRELGARAVYTHDRRHLRQLGAPVVEFEVFLSLRDYARAEAVEVAIRFGTGATILLGLVALRGVVALILWMVRIFSRLPPAVLVALLAVGGIALLDSEVRGKLTDVSASWLRRLAATGARLRPAVERLSAEYAAAVETSQRAWAEAQMRLPATRRPPPLRSRARAICAAAAAPIPEAELERRIRADGVATRARDFPRYLRRVLRSDERLQEVSRRVWALRRA